MKRKHFVGLVCLLLVFLIFACRLPGRDGVSQPTPVASRVESATPRTSATEVVNFNKWDLWSNGTQLRGINIWQATVIPELDGLEFKGEGRVGPPYIQSDFDELAALGANYVNLSHAGIFTERSPHQLDEGVLDNLDRLVEMARQADMFVVISFRTGPGRAEFSFYYDGDPQLQPYLNDSMWQDAAAQDAWVEMWRQAALHFRGDPVVAGYDLMVEPNSSAVGSDQLTDMLDIYDPETFYSQYAGTLYDWNQLYPRIVTAIREVDPDTPILIGGNGWSNLEWLPYLDVLDEEGIVYTFHQYAPHEYTHQSWKPWMIEYPGEMDLDWDGEDDAFDRSWLEGYLQIAGDFQIAHDVPVAVNEYGVIRWVPGAATFMADEMEIFEELGVNYSSWAWNPAWEPFKSIDDFEHRHGTDPLNHSNVAESEVMDVLMHYWSRNTIRPSMLP